MFNELPLPAGSGSLQFRELASRAAATLDPAGVNDAWKFWLDILIAYLLTNDPDEEYLNRLPAGHIVRPEGATCDTP